MASCEFSEEEEIQSCAFGRKEHDNNFLGLRRTSAIMRGGTTINSEAYVNVLRKLHSQMQCLTTLADFRHSTAAWQYQDARQSENYEGDKKTEMDSAATPTIQS
jgi:hypothetical protein